MNHMVHVLDKIRTNTAAIGRLEAALPEHRESRGLVSNIISLRRLQQSLEAEFQGEADRAGLDVCHYRIPGEVPSARALSHAILGFQDSLAHTYDALRNGPKARRHLSAQAASESTLQVAYTYPGSFGVVFMVPNERMLFPEAKSALDKAAATVMEIGKAASDIEIVSRVVQEVGRGAIAAIYDWAAANSHYETGAMIEWRRGEATRTEVSIQAAEFAALSVALERNAEQKEDLITVEGVLVGADTASHRFHFVVDGTDSDIRGTFDEVIGPAAQKLLPARYLAEMRKSTQRALATDEEKVNYILLRLSPLPVRA